MVYILDFFDILKKVTPVHLRQVVILDWIKSIIKPLDVVNTSFTDLIAATDYKLLFSGQTIYLEHYLNDLYDPVNRGIFIQDVANISYQYIYQKAEAKPPLYLYNNSENNPVFIYNNSEYAAFIQFIVKVPIAVTFNETIMRREVDYYKLAGKQYTIETY